MEVEDIRDEEEDLRFEGEEDIDGRIDQTASGDHIGEDTVSEFLFIFVSMHRDAVLLDGFFSSQDATASNINASIKSI